MKPEHRQRIAEALRGRKLTPDHCRAIADAKRGRPAVPRGPMPLQQRQAISAAKRGRAPRHSDETRAKIVARNRERTGPAHPLWKGDEVSYVQLHQWVERHRPKTGACSGCGATGCRTEWANVSGEYRRDLDDWVELCVSCHRKADRAEPKRQHSRYAASQG